ncbi:MAG TPA: glucosaminidase domain-containing protein [Alphaproteobacteria bacterium]|nr:glucosaminidase domain-containing protein [Alphaproteobacteria bacterium]
MIRKRARCEDQDFIYAALGGLTLCVAALYLAVALPRLAPLVAPKLLGEQGRGIATAWIPSDNMADANGAAVAPGAGRGLEKPTQVTRIGSVEKLADLFATMDYSLDSAANDVQVPRVFLASLPSDFKSVSSIDTRKELFIRTMLPLVLKVNEGILLDRGRLLALRARAASGRAPTAEEAGWLNDLAERYGLEKPDFGQLLSRVDIVPASLALSQAAEESGWGTSRFARQGNAAFGQITFSEDDGLVPSRRDDGKRHLVRTYDHLLDGVKSYAQNLNTHDAYRQFRKVRAQMRARGEDIEGFRLSGSLTGYSERGGEYVDTIQTIMRANNLESLDRAKLRGGQMGKLLAAGK